VVEYTTGSSGVLGERKPVIRGGGGGDDDDDNTNSPVEMSI